jgi:hypothetical protein
VCLPGEAVDHWNDKSRIDFLCIGLRLELSILALQRLSSNFKLKFFFERENFGADEDMSVLIVELSEIMK